jgi:hypothetical protein
MHRRLAAPAAELPALPVLAASHQHQQRMLINCRAVSLFVGTIDLA